MCVLFSECTVRVRLRWQEARNRVMGEETKMRSVEDDNDSMAHTGVCVLFF